MPKNNIASAVILLFVSIAFSAEIAVDAYRSSLARLHIRPSRENGVGRFRLNAHHDEGGIALLSSLAGGYGRGHGDDSDAIESKIVAMETAYRDFNATIIGDDIDIPSSRFERLLGLYEVRAVISANINDNPVGGKWTKNNGLVQRLFRTRATYQHLLPVNSTGLTTTTAATTAIAEAMNVVSLDALDGTFRITVVLRGDAMPLTRDERRIMNANRNMTNEAFASSDAPPPPITNLAVRAVFDPPRIFLGRRVRRRMRIRRRGEEDGGGGGGGGGDGKGCDYSYLPLIVGPSSSVVLDTTYCDEHVRIGRGGRSGTCFVFATTSSTTEAEERGGALEYDELMKLPVKKWSPICKLGMVLAASLYVALGCGAGFDRLVSPCHCARIADSRIYAVTSRFIHARLIALFGIALRVVGGITSVVSGIILSLLLFSGGGIERDDVSRSRRTPSSLNA